MSEILSKSVKKIKYEKKYKCPYCEDRLPRKKLGNHIEKLHSDMIPKGYTANRVAFNSINKKDHGTCVICGKESPWNESKCRYDRYCSKTCISKAAKIAEKNTKRHEQLRGPDAEKYQKEMLNNRKISGTYKFSTGGEMRYVGSYEKEFLSAMDLLMGVKVEDLQQPGPTIEYEYDGKKRKWITDFYYIPYNLVFDIKDGGDNPNTREMPEYRAKQTAKEKAIQSQGKYNYIRATNKEFDQVFTMMAELKALMLDPDSNKPDTISRIHETMAPMMFSLPKYNAERVYIVNYLQNNVFAGKKESHYALCRDYMSDIVVYDGENFVKMELEEFANMAYNIKCYQFLEEANFMDILKNSKNDKDFYINLTHKNLLNYDQIAYDPIFEEVVPMTTKLKMIAECVEATAFESLSNCVTCENNILNIPNVITEIDKLTGIQYRRDIDGEFVYNKEANLRSPSYPTKQDIPLEMINLLRSI